MSCNNTVQVMTKNQVCPSYMAWFEKNPVNLIYAKKPSVASASDCVETSIEKEIKEDELDDIDLTGDPLKVDLGHDESIQIFEKESTIQVWSLDEAKHYPLPVRTARRELNKILKKPDSNQTLSTYIICNGDDPQKTILLGGNNKDFMACSVNVLGILTSEQIKQMQKLEESSFDGQVSEYLDKKTYNLYGKSLKNFYNKNASIRQLSSVHGSINVEVISSKNNKAEKDQNKMIVHLEIITGHEILKLHFLWNELIKLQELIGILSDSNEDAVIDREPIDQDIILKSIIELLSSKYLKRENGKEAVDLNNIRQADLLDGLWSILICCENISILRDSFMFLFEELAAGITRKNLPIKDNCSKISLIIKNISDGKIGVPDISHMESVELLFELGAQKLKFDFEVILAQFTNNIKAIQTIWSKFYEHGEEEVKMHRRTRATRGLKCTSVKSLDSKIKQLGYLSQLYVASEFIYLLKENVNLNDEISWNVYGCIEKEFILHCDKIQDFVKILHNPLIETCVDLNVRNDPFNIKSLSPSRWIMSMKYGNKSLTETVIYHSSDSPIFPPSIYDFDVPDSNGSENTQYIVTKMSCSTGLF